MEIDFNKIKIKNNIIDIRNSYDYNINGIKGSINIPRMLLLSEYDKYIKKDEVYYLICDNGKVSLSCCRILNALGYKCYSIKGGIKSI